MVRAMITFRCLTYFVVSIVISSHIDVICCAAIGERTGNETNNVDGSVLGDIMPGSVLYEYDMMLTADQYTTMKDEIDNKMLHSESRKKRKAINSMASLWWSKVIPYNITDGIFTLNEVQKIHEAIDEWSNFTCIQFREANNDDTRIVTISTGDGCWSNIGLLTDGNNKIALGGGCRSKDIIVHEIGHTVGFYHEHSRPDRDDYVSVLFDNVNKSASYNFQKKSWSEVSTYDLPYDYTSVMHYREKAFSVNDQLTINTKDPKYQKVIGNGKGLSFLDIKLANLMYSCSENCPVVKCPGQGFVGKDCKCWCPGDPVQLCDQSVTTPTAITTTTTTTIRIPVKIATPECSDRSTYCPHFVKSELCNKNIELARKFCKMSCRFCDKDESKPCIDMHVGCPALQKLGHCSNRYFAASMSKQCPHSCNMC